MTSSFADLLAAPTTAVLATLGPDGAPHAQPVWFLARDDHIEVSTTADRQKVRNIGRDPRVTFTVVDPVRATRYIEIRGRAEVVDDPTAATRDEVARKHGFVDGAAFDPPGTRRLTIRIRPIRSIDRSPRAAS